MHVTLVVVMSLLAAAWASPMPQEDEALLNIEPVATADYDPCVERGPRYYQYHSDPHKFIDCGDNMVPTLKSCPQHLVWNPLANYCDYPEHVGVTSVTFTTHPPLYVQGPGIAGQHVYTTGFAAPCTRERVQRNQMFWPYPGYVQYYIMCDSSGNSLVMACLPDHVYYELFQSCVSTHTQSPGAVSTRPPIYVTRPPGTTPSSGTGVIGGGGILSSTGFKAPCTTEHVQKDQLYWPYPGSSHFYIQCDLFGNAYLMACQPGNSYNHPSHTCVVGATQSPGSFITNAPAFTTPSNIAKPQAGSVYGTGYSAPCTHDVVNRNELYWPYPGLPNLYIHCDLFGDSLVQACQPGFIYYHASHTCVGSTPVG